MLLTSLFLLALAAALLTLYARGFVVARGRFCRACRFDLAGLTDAPACPECGGDLSAPRAVSPVLLRRHRAILAAGVLLLLCSVAMLGYLGFTNRSSILPSLPNRILIPLEAAGVSEARTVIAMRAQDPEAFTDAQWQTLLTRALAHQADTTVAWDTRWGDVLGYAFVSRRMSEPQMAAYLSHGVISTVRIRDRAAVDQPWLGYAIDFGYGRIRMSPRPAGSGPPQGLQTPFRIHQSVVRTGTGEVGQPTGGGSGDGRFYIPWSVGGDRGGVAHIILMQGFDRADPPAEVVAFVETQTELTHAQTSEPVLTVHRRHEQQVELLPAGTPIIRTITDPTSADSIRDAAEVTPLRVDPGDPESGDGARSTRLELWLPECLHTIAGKLYVVSPDGQETPLGSIVVRPDGPRKAGVRTTFWDDPEDPQDAARFSRSLEWLARAEVDVAFRTDTAAAVDDPKVQNVVDVTLWFRDVPVTIEGESSTAAGPRARVRAEGAG
jgi:hypothetical protein